MIRKYVHNTIKLCCDLVNNKKIDKNRYKELLLGTKAKIIVQSFLKILPIYFPTIKFIYFDTDNTLLLDKILLWLYDNGFQQTKLFPTNIEWDDTPEKYLYVMKILERNKIKLFIILDNFDRVYTSKIPKEESQYHMEHVAVLLNSFWGNIQLIVTGESDLEQLCFTTHKIDYNKYPNYCGYDLNCTKLNLIKLF